MRDLKLNQYRSDVHRGGRQCLQTWKTSEKSGEDNSAVESPGSQGRQALCTVLSGAPGVPGFSSERQRLRGAGRYEKNPQALS